jgi:hypothetical protein
MAKDKMTISEFITRLPKFAKATQSLILKEWDKNTLEATSKAKIKTPAASFALERANTRLKARITPTGIKSFIVNRLPYARKLHDDTSLRLKNPGELSYYRRGGKVFKRKKGEHEFISKAVTEQSGELTRDIFNAIDKAWNAL